MPAAPAFAAPLARARLARPRGRAAVCAPRAARACAPPPRDGGCDAERALRALRADAGADAAYVAGLAGPPPSSCVRLLQVLEKHGVRGEALSRAVVRAGARYVLALDPGEAEKVLVLLEGVGFEGRGVARMVAGRPALLEDAEGVRGRVALLREVCFTDRDIRHVAGKWPGLLAVDADRARSVIAVLCDGDVGFTRASLRSVLRRAPWLLVYDARVDVAPALAWLRGALGRARVERVVRACPHVLGMSPEAMQRVLCFLRERVAGVGGDEVVLAVVRQFPPILAADVGGQLAPALRFLQALALGGEDVARIVRAFPAVLVLDVEREMRPNVEFLRASGVQNVGRVVARLPPVLAYDIETILRPKLDFVLGLGLNVHDVLRFPGYFSYSLTDVIEPRTRFLQLLGVPLSDTGLNMALAPTDAAFCERVANAPLHEYEHFRAALCEKRTRIQAGDLSDPAPPYSPAQDAAVSAPVRRFVHDLVEPLLPAARRAGAPLARAARSPAPAPALAPAPVARGPDRADDYRDEPQRELQHVRAIPPSLRPVCPPRPRRRKRRLRATDARLPWDDRALAPPGDIEQRAEEAGQA